MIILITYTDDSIRVRWRTILTLILVAVLAGCGGNSSYRSNQLRDAAAYTNLGNGYLEMGDYDAAIADYNRAIKRNSSEAAAYFGRGLAYKKKGDVKRATANTNRAIKLNPMYRTVTTLAEASSSASKPHVGDERKLATNDKTAKNVTNDKGTEALFTGGFSTSQKRRNSGMAKSKKYGPVIAGHSRAIELNPRDYVGYFFRGKAYSYKGDYDRAIADFDRAIELNPKYATAYKNRDIAYEAKRQQTQIPSPSTQGPSIVRDDQRVTTERPDQATIPASSEQSLYDHVIAGHSRAIELNPRDDMASKHTGSYKYEDEHGPKTVISANMRIALDAFKRKNYKTSFQEFSLVAKKGDKLAQGFLGFHYERGLGVAKSYTDAEKWYRKAAEKSYPRAMYVLGRFYEIGRSVDQDYDKALEWYRKAAEKSYPKAMTALGRFYAAGRSVDQDYDKALEWYRKAAEKSDSKAMYALGWFYETGRSVDQNYDKALEWYRKAAEKNHSKAIYALGRFYATGRSVDQDYDKALKWYRKAAGTGNNLALVTLGNVYVAGNIAEKDYEEAAKWYRKAIVNNHTPAIYALGWLHLQGGPGIDKDVKRAMEIILQAAELGNLSAQQTLGDAYRVGQGVKKDLNTSVKWYLLAAEQGSPEGQYNLAIAYEKGMGVDKNLDKSKSWLGKAAKQGHKRAVQKLSNKSRKVKKFNKQEVNELEARAERGDASAQADLATAYLIGAGVSQDIKKSVAWYLKAAEQGNILAQNNLGVIYRSKKYGLFDLKKSFHWYEKAAIAEYAEAQYQVGVRYEGAYGVNQNKGKALEWYTKAAEQGHEAAIERLKEKTMAGTSCNKLLGGRIYQPPQTHEEAFAKANAGDVLAQSWLGKVYRNKHIAKLLGVEKDIQKAIQWDRKAAENNDRISQKRLAFDLLKGDSVERNVMQAIYWFEQAAAQCDRQAMYLLGRLYALGIDVPSNLEKSMYWYNKLADEFNEKKASAIRDRLQKGESPENIYHKK